MGHHSEPLPVLAQEAVAVVAVAARLWPAGHPCLQQLTSKVNIAMHVCSAAPLQLSRYLHCIGAVVHLINQPLTCEALLLCVR